MWPDLHVGFCRSSHTLSTTVQACTMVESEIIQFKSGHGMQVLHNYICSRKNMYAHIKLSTYCMIITIMVPQTANSHLQVSCQDVTRILTWIHLQSNTHLLLSKLTQMCHWRIFQHNQVPYKCKHSWAFAFSAWTCWITACYVPISYVHVNEDALHCLMVVMHS